MDRYHRAVPVLLVLFTLPLWGACGEGAPGGGEGGAPDAGGADAPAAEGAPDASEEEGTAPASGIPEGGLERWTADIHAGLEEVRAEPQAARQQVLDLYVGRQEYIEMFYGPGGRLTGNDHPELADAVEAQETRFHELMALTGADDVAADDVRAKVAELESHLDRTLELAREAGLPLDRAGESGDGSAAADDDPDALLGGGAPAAGGDEPAGGAAEVSMPEIRDVLAQLDEAERAWEAGDRAAALAAVEEAYLEGFEPLESRLAQSSVQRVERLIHLSLRPRLSRGAPDEEVAESFAAVRTELRAADTEVARAGGSFWFGAINSLIIIVREGLEAVLLVGALLAYLANVEGGREHHPRIWAGVGLGIAASFATWFAASTLIPVTGGSRELIEGVTALLAVAVLIYVSNWIFQRTYLHHWKDFLREKLDTALTTGSAFAMAALAFAAVYREGFETVLFYQALLFDVGAGPVLAGFVPGLLLIVAVGAGIIRLGLRLPLRQVFAATNAILIYLAFTFTGKGLYNLQEAGLFAPHPLGWVPDSEALRLTFGIYPVAETLAGQALLLLGVGATYVYYRRKSAAGAEEEKTDAAKAPETAAGAGPREEAPAAG